MQKQTFPSHRQLYTSLIDAAISQQQQTSSNFPCSNPSPSPLSQSRRRLLLLTLHVLFPSLVLSALDLLDRRFVTRFVAPDHQGRHGHHQSGSAGTTQTQTQRQGFSGGDIGGGDDEARRHEAASITMYIVQSTVSHRRRDARPVSKRYLVHTRAWNCSCPAFALDASHHSHPHHPSLKAQGKTGVLDFGGLSLDGSWDDVPCCKHLLACFLAERWDGDDLLGGHVETVTATKEEMAAIVASL